MDIPRNGYAFRMPTLIYEFTQECLSIKVGRKLKTERAIVYLIELFCAQGIPKHIHSVNGLESSAKRIRDCLTLSAYIL